MWIDIHAHLYSLSDKELSKVISELKSKDISCVINTATDLDSCSTVLNQETIFNNLYPGIGISPFEADTLDNGWEQTIESMVEDNDPVCIGEIGLDSSNSRYPSIDNQLPLFLKQLSIAEKFKLPVVMHSRGAEKRVLDICCSENIEKAVFHCYTGRKSTMKKILDRGYYISFSGIITYDPSLKGHIQYAPLDRLFIETDSPYLSPVPRRNEKNTPANIGFIGKKIADTKKITIEELSETIKFNFQKMFNRNYFI